MSATRKTLSRGGVERTKRKRGGAARVRKRRVSEGQKAIKQMVSISFSISNTQISLGTAAKIRKIIGRSCFELGTKCTS